MGIELYLKKKELNDQVIVEYKEEEKKHLTISVRIRHRN
ncbi:hypothetical protein H476_3459 [[Clostridium] sordellii VPI 9048]|nr:hypothetical protein H476_3459 [[Clostridium] sordellii VPI 9048] [Paeniclostridium sordellii VPI 9048]